MGFQNEQNPPPPEDLSLQIFDHPSCFPKQQDINHENSVKSMDLNRPFRSSIEQMFDQSYDNNDSSASTTASRSVHLPVEKQRGISEILRKRNSRCKVEDYRRSIQKPTSSDDQQYNPTVSTSKSDQQLASLTNHTDDISSLPLQTNSTHFQKAYSVDIPIDAQMNNDKRVKMSIERLNLLLSSKDDRNEQDKDSNEYVTIKKSETE